MEALIRFEHCALMALARKMRHGANVRHLQSISSASNYFKNGKSRRWTSSVLVASWVMDMVFRDDECRICKDHAPANFATVKRMASNLLRRASGKDSLRFKRKMGAWDDEFLAGLIAPNQCSPDSPGTGEGAASFGCRLSAAIERRARRRAPLCGHPTTAACRNGHFGHCSGCCGGTMQHVSARDAKYGFGRLIDLARNAPVTVEKHGRPVVVVMSVEEFKRLKAFDPLPNLTQPIAPGSDGTVRQ
jgi:prevent-host-death family protein